MKKLDGVWEISKAILDGRTLPPEAVKPLILTIGNSQYQVGVVDKGNLLFGGSGEVDVVGVEGPNAGKTIKAIYAIKPDLSEATICYNLSGGERPTIFLSEKGSGYFLVTYIKKNK